MRIFIAGGTGVLGRRIVPLLVERGHEVVATTRSETKAEFIRELGAEPAIMDALDRGAVATAVREAVPDAVLHLLTDLAEGDPTSNATVRIEGTRHLVDAAQAVGVRRLVAESISWVCEPGEGVADESSPLDLGAAEPRRTTVAAVAELERLVLGFGEGVVLRCGQLYGAGTWFAADGRFADLARAGRLPAVESVGSFLHADDAAAAYVAALEWGPGVYNVVDDDPAAGTEWAPAFAAAVGAGVPAAVETGDPGRPVSNAKAKAAGLALAHPNWRGGFATL